MNHYLQAFLAAMLLSLAVTPVVRFWGYQWGILDRPNARKVHHDPVPRLGGLGIYFSFALVLLVMWPWPEAAKFLIPAGLMFLVGLLDDIHDLRPVIKLAGQVAAAVVLALLGVRIQFMTNPLGGMIYLGWWGIPLTILWVVGLTNVVNLVDGLDGLAAGVVFIAAASVFFVGLAGGQTLVALLAVILAGAMLGFLPYNFHPASIFLGDGGSQVAGFLLAAIAAAGAVKGPTTLALGVAIMALGVPIFDTFFAVVRRFWSGRPIYVADRDHLHHRLLARGFSQREAVLLVYGMTTLLGGLALLAVKWGMTLPLWLVLAGMGGLALFMRRLGVLTLPTQPLSVPSRSRVHHLGG